MTEETRYSIRDVIASVELRDVSLMEASVRTLVRDAASVPNAELSVSHGTKIINRTSDGFLVGAKLMVQISTADRKIAEPPVSINVSFALAYSLPGAAHFSDAVLEEFARVNGAFNVWPYWREYVQTTAARMNLPPLVLPVFRVATRSTEVEERITTARKTPRGAAKSARRVSRKQVRRAR